MIRSLDDWLSYIENLHPSNIDMSLERSKEVLLRMKISPIGDLIFIIGGTNGKGSTCYLLESLLKSQGFSVGKYTSPHILRYNERICIRGVEVKDIDICNAFTVVNNARGEISLTYFEFTTLAAFWLFKKEDLDAIILEVGLGGRYDTVNLVNADCVAITNIAIDHKEYLGNSRESIAFEKSGVFRKQIPVIYGESDPPQTLIIEASKLDCKLYLKGRDFELRSSKNSNIWQGLNAEGEALVLDELPTCKLPIENFAVALQAYLSVGLAWDPKNTRKLLEEASMVGRLYSRDLIWKGKKISFLLDVSHNAHAVSYLSRKIVQAFPADKRLAVFGLLINKDLAEMIFEIIHLIDHWAVAPLISSKTTPAINIANHLREKGSSVVICEDISDALRHQCDRASSYDQIVVFGSFHCVTESIRWIEKANFSEYNTV